MEDRQFSGYQQLRSELEIVIENFEWAKEDLIEALDMLKEDGEEYLEGK